MFVTLNIEYITTITTAVRTIVNNTEQMFGEKEKKRKMRLKFIDDYISDKTMM